MTTATGSPTKRTRSCARPGRNGIRTELPPTPLKNDSTGGVFQPVATMSAPVMTSSTPLLLRASRGVDPHDPGVRAVGAQEMRRDLSVEMMIGGVTALAGDEPLIFPAAPELMLCQFRIPNWFSDEDGRIATIQPSSPSFRGPIRVAAAFSAVVPAKAGTHRATTSIGGYGSPPSRGRQ